MSKPPRARAGKPPPYDLNEVYAAVKAGLHVSKMARMPEAERYRVMKERFLLVLEELKLKDEHDRSAENLWKKFKVWQTELINVLGPMWNKITDGKPEPPSGKSWSELDEQLRRGLWAHKETKLIEKWKKDKAKANAKKVAGTDQEPDPVPDRQPKPCPTPELWHPELWSAWQKLGPRGDNVEFITAAQESGPSKKPAISANPQDGRKAQRKREKLQNTKDQQATKARVLSEILTESRAVNARADRRSNIEEKKMLYELKRGTDGEEQARLDLIAALEAPRPAGPVRAETPEPQVPKAPAKTRPSPTSLVDISSDDEAAPAEE